MCGSCMLAASASAPGSVWTPTCRPHARLCVEPATPRVKALLLWLLLLAQASAWQQQRHCGLAVAYRRVLVAALARQQPRGRRHRTRLQLALRVWLLRRRRGALLKLLLRHWAGRPHLPSGGWLPRSLRLCL